MLVQRISSEVQLVKLSKMLVQIISSEVCVYYKMIDFQSIVSYLSSENSDSSSHGLFITEAYMQIMFYTLLNASDYMPSQLM
jgi:hypothetical protein